MIEDGHVGVWPTTAVLVKGADDLTEEARMTLDAMERSGQLVIVDKIKDMNPDTGKIEVFENESALNAAQADRIAGGKAPLIPLDQMPNPKCKKCYGRGHIGKDLKTGLMIPCKCVKKTNKVTKVQGAAVSTSKGW